MVLPRTIITKSAEETKKFGEKFGHSFLAGEDAKRPRVICLWGELGSGKTTFVQGVAKGFGITTRLLSPTFIIVRHYQIPDSTRSIYHLDLYRINHEEDAAAVGFPDMIADPHAIVIVEWPERLGRLLPDNRVDIRCETHDNGQHSLTITYG
ncbi:tRNA (adenosine(37)-N6)-threonylcarbamoyltransferase complex ATPase subunit type 1 TsaE [Patescibacteria group bacterium]|nr:tRNA (adenosine(37)-N6)-threonylcarbamoyltransferase complex ATPase subunit type 1 TsaE [Patescibacteria group bacterium]